MRSVGRPAQFLERTGPSYFEDAAELALPL
jgi:hypothetical protein